MHRRCDATPVAPRPGSMSCQASLAAASARLTPDTLHSRARNAACLASPAYEPLPDARRVRGGAVRTAEALPTGASPRHRPPTVARRLTPSDTVDARAYDPQQALLVAEPPTGERWVHELKLDGFRMGVFVAGRGKARGARIISRRGADYTAEFPEIVAAAMKLRAKAAVLDGEVVVLDERGRSSFQLLQQLGASRRGLAYFAFDLLALDGEDIRALPLEERKRRLEKLVGRRASAIRYTPHFDADGPEILATACRLGAEGIV